MSYDALVLDFVVERVVRRKGGRWVKGSDF